MQRRLQTSIMVNTELQIHDFSLESRKKVFGEDLGIAWELYTSILFS